MEGTSKPQHFKMSPILLRTNLFRGFNGQILKNLEDEDDDEYPGKARLFWMRHEHSLGRKPRKLRILQPFDYQRHATSVHGEHDDEPQLRILGQMYVNSGCGIQAVSNCLHQSLRMIRLLQKRCCFPRFKQRFFRIFDVAAGIDHFEIGLACP
jgi:hypothetical protein